MATNSKMHPIPGSERRPMAGARILGPAPANERLDVTVRIRPKNPLPDTAEIAHAQAPLSHDEYDKLYGASPDDIAKVEAFAKANNLKVVDVSPARRSMILSGTVEDFNKAFDVTLQCHEHANHTYRGRTGVISVPADLSGVVEGVFGLDDRTFAKPHYTMRRIDRPTSHATTSLTFEVPQITELYNFPAGLDGKGQTIGIIELGGGYRPADLKAYFNRVHLPMPKVVPVSVDGGKNKTGSDADVEVVLDIEVAGAAASGASLVVYFASDATDQGFLDAITQAVHDTTHNPSVISISWGGQETAATDSFQQQFNDALKAASLLGITVCVASGDNGAADVGPNEWDGKAHCDFPASSPYALACGGTRLTASGTSISQETVWNQGVADTQDDSFGSGGGGVSTVFPVPSWQANAHVPNAAGSNTAGRGVPDVAGNADSATGYNILMTINGQRQAFPVGGTSAVAPLWAGLIARINQKKGGRVGFINPAIYALSPGSDAFHDITVGNNRVGDALVGYDAASGWDPCTGLGSPNGTNLMNALLGTGASAPSAVAAAAPNSDNVKVTA
jgi:kumamolisin